MSILGRLKRRRVSSFGAANAIAAITLIVVGLVFVLLASDEEALTPEQQARPSESSSPRPTADSDRFGTRSEPQTPATGSQVDGSDSAPTNSAGDAAERLDLDSAEAVRIPIPGELAAWFEEAGPGAVERHERLEREPRNSEWADALEADVLDFINSKPDLLNVRILSLECRTMSCEILGVAYGDEAYRTWVLEMSELFQEEWMEQWFHGPTNVGCGGQPMAPGVIAIGCSFSPSEPESDQPAPLEGEGVDVDSLSLSERMTRLRARDSGLAELYREMQSEPTDPSWSVYMETQLTEFLTNHPDLGDSTIVSIECRSNFCEMQAVDSSLLNWGLVVPDFYSQSWHDLNIASVIGEPISSEQDGLIWILRRREPGDP